MSWWVSLSPPDLHYSQSCRHLTHPAVFAAQSVWASRWGSTFICSDNILTSVLLQCHSSIVVRAIGERVVCSSERWSVSLCYSSVDWREIFEFDLLRDSNIISIVCQDCRYSFRLTSDPCPVSPPLTG